MSLSMRIAAHLPYLRRFSRAVTGSQASGDAYVAAVLEALIADISLFPQGSTDRVSLYKLFCSQMDKVTITLPDTSSPFGWENKAAENLARISPAARKAFLLTSVEGFSTVETAHILGVSEAEADALLDRASHDISRQVATDILIIEDEPLIAMDIEQMVLSLGHRVTGIARTRTEAMDLFRADPPGMVLADIQLADGSSGIDAVNDMLRASALPVIFITAFPEHLLTGERPEPAFLVTKPFDENMVKALIGQALFFHEAASVAA